MQLRDIPTFRGVIKDRNGEMLAGNRPSFDIYVVPSEVDDNLMLADRLGELIGMSPAVITEKIEAAYRRSPFKPVSIKKDISRDELAVIETHRFSLPGLKVEARPIRHYLFGSLGAHIIGYLGEINDKEIKSGQYPHNKAGDMIGKAGVESTWQEVLTGISGAESLEVDAAGRTIRVLSRRPPLSGENLWLTIDRDLQSLSEEILSEKKGAIVAMEPSTGRILAMASSPSFDPNLFVEGIAHGTWEQIVRSEGFPLQNRVLSGQYPPASVFKIVVALAALDKGLIDQKDEVLCPGIYRLGDYQFRCWKKHGHGVVNLHRALVESCDVYFYVLGRRMGVDTIASYARRMGLGELTGVGIGNEKPGLIPTTGWKLKRMGVPWQAGETISASIGQGYVLATPLQVARLISAVFNGGILYRPQLALFIENGRGEKTRLFPPEPERELGIKPEAIALVKKSLIGVVNEPRGTGSKALLKDALVAGKTGTAQVVRLEKDRDEERDGQEDIPLEFRDHAWFAGVAPAEDPKIAVAIIVENGGHGSKAAAPLAGALFKSFLKARE